MASHSLAEKWCIHLSRIFALIFLILILFLLYYPMVIKDEGKRLLHLNGKKFTAYCKKTPAFTPKLSLLEEPETYAVNPKIFKRNIFGALWQGLPYYCAS